jgi:DNA-directed RNA polymerase subunit M/transcription elongation factor TFIIS
MAILRLDSCPKCKGQLLLEKDNYGLYQQCLQCGYLHDLQAFPVLDSEKTEDEKELVGSRHATAEGTRYISKDTPRLFESSRSTALADPFDLHLILDALHKIHQD